MITPKISVIMPVYNGATYLHEAIESILGQTFMDFEFLICNEYESDDGSVDIISEYAEKDSRIIPLQNDRRLGISASLNRMLDIAKGEFIARMDADDISGPRRFETQLIYMDRYPEIDCFGINHSVIGSNGWKVQYHSDPEIVKAQTLLFVPMRHPTTMWRAGCGVKYDDKMSGVEDMRLYQVMARKLKLSNIQDKSLFVYRVSNEMLSKKMNERDSLLRRDNIKLCCLEMLGFKVDNYDANTLCFVLGATKHNGKKELSCLIRLEELLKDIISANYNISAYEPYALCFLAYHRWHKEMEWIKDKYKSKKNIPSKLLEIYEASPFYRYAEYGRF